MAASALQDSRFRRHRMAMETSGDEDLSSTYAVPPPTRPARRGASPSQQQQQASSLNRRAVNSHHQSAAISPSRVSPSRDGRRFVNGFNLDCKRLVWYGMFWRTEE